MEVDSGNDSSMECGVFTRFSIIPCSIGNPGAVTMRSYNELKGGKMLRSVLTLIVSREKRLLKRVGSKSLHCLVSGTLKSPMRFGV